MLSMLNCVFVEGLWDNIGGRNGKRRKRGIEEFSYKLWYICVLIIVIYVGNDLLLRSCCYVKFGGGVILNFWCIWGKNSGFFCRGSNSGFSVE